MDDRSAFAKALAAFLTEFGQHHWHAIERYRPRSRLAFIHAKKRVPGGTDEAMIVVTASGESYTIEHYALLEGRKNWLLCDEAAFQGLLREGPRGLKLGKTEPDRATCRCDRKAHRSSGRAQKYARMLAARYGKAGVQRPYRCDDNPRVFHLTAQQKGSQELIPDAYIDPREGDAGQA